MHALFRRRALPACAAALAVHATAAWLVAGGAMRVGAGAVRTPAVSLRMLAPAPAVVLAAPVPAATPAHRGPPAQRSPAVDGFAPSALLDRAAVPRSAPDTSVLEGLPFSGLPIRLRLFVDRSGAVVEARVLQTAEADEVAEAVREMFLATAFIPGRLRGQDVGSYEDVEIAFGASGSEAP